MLSQKIARCARAFSGTLPAPPRQAHAFSVKSSNQKRKDTKKARAPLNRLVLSRFFSLEQFKIAFEQTEKEVTDLHSRISQGIRKAKKNGAQIGLSKGTTLTTKKSLQCQAIIKKHSKDFGGTLDDPDVMKLCGCSRNSYYKYKRDIKSNGS